MKLCKNFVFYWTVFHGAKILEKERNYILLKLSLKINGPILIFFINCKICFYFRFKSPVILWNICICMYMDMYLNNLYLLTCTPISVILTHQLTKCCPQPCLEWMAAQVTRNRLASQWVLSQMDIWVEPYLLGNNNARVRSAAACLLTSLVPSTHFRNTFRQNRNLLSPHKEMTVGLRIHCFINVHY